MNSMPQRLIIGVQIMPHYKVVRIRQWVAIGIVIASIVLELLWCGSILYSMIP